MVLPHAAGEEPTMRWHRFIVRGRHILPRHRLGGVGAEEGSLNWEAGEQGPGARLCCASLKWMELSCQPVLTLQGPRVLYRRDLMPSSQPDQERGTVTLLSL